MKRFVLDSPLGLLVFGSFLVMYAILLFALQFGGWFVYPFIVLGGFYLIGAGLSVKKYRTHGLKAIEQVASISRSGVFITNSEANIIYANDAFLELTGYTRDELLGENPRILRSGKHDKAFYESLWKGLVEEGSFEGNIWDKKKSGAIYPKHIRIRRIDDPYMKTYYYVAIQEDLTGGGDDSYIEYHSRSLLPNQQALKNLIQRDYLPDEVPFTLYYIRIQNRSSLETAFGREKYTKLLQHYATKVNEYLNEKGFVAEITHYALVVVSPYVKDKIHQDATQMVRLGRTLKVDDVEAYFNINIGVARYPEDGDNTDELFRNARVSLDHIQYLPGKSYALHEESLEKELKEELTIGSHLPSAIENKEFHMVYQPQYKEGKIVGVEALLRWDSPTLGRVEPDTFIKVAEEGGRMRELTVEIFKLLKQDLKEILKKAPDIRFGINISISQLMDHKCLQGFAEIHTLTGLPADQLEIEVTEGGLIDDVDLVAEKLKAFKDKKIRVAIDDFGTG
ncbi:MAG: EAL domain-containing protein, partial [Bacillota bacterium]